MRSASDLSTLTSSLGASASTSTSLKAEACDELAFKPTFTASTNGRTSRADGASLSVKLTMPVKLGTQSNIKTVKVELPKQLPSRLTTLQKACTEAQFNANPAGCPAASFIGRARANTPILPVPLEGPAIFVSHGGEAFPSLILVLQGYGFTIEIVGQTFISLQGVTSTTFHTIPDEPVGSFQITIPQGPYSALAANANLCKLRAAKTKTVLERVKLRRHGRVVRRHGRPVYVKRRVKRRTGGLEMPTEFVAQNGAKIKQDTRISVTGCSKRVVKTKAKAKKKAKGGKKARK